MSGDEISTRREAAKLIKKIRSDRENSPNGAMLENFVWVIYTAFNDIGFQDVEITESEMDDILNSLPSGWQPQD